MQVIKITKVTYTGITHAYFEGEQFTFCKRFKGFRKEIDAKFPECTRCGSLVLSYREAQTSGSGTLKLTRKEE